MGHRYSTSSDGGTTGGLEMENAVYLIKMLGQLFRYNVWQFDLQPLRLHTLLGKDCGKHQGKQVVSICKMRVQK